MNDAADRSPFLQREILVNALYEAAELEHNLMCRYLYAAADRWSIGRLSRHLMPLRRQRQQALLRRHA
jgi:hypothetical protein